MAVRRFYVLFVAAAFLMLGTQVFRDGSVFPTGGAVNPSLTIEAIATRVARLVLEAA